MITAAIDAANGLQPDTDQWNGLMDAVNATEALLNQSGIPSAQKKRIHAKQHEVEEFLEAGEPYDMGQVEIFTQQLNSML